MWEYNLRAPSLEGGVNSIAEMLDYLLDDNWRVQVNLIELYNILEKEQMRYWETDPAAEDITEHDREILQDRERYILFKAIFGDNQDNPSPNDTINPATYEFMMRKIKSKINGTWNDEIYPEDDI